jgi:hypothetical protein
MEVYVVEYGYEYEGDTVIAVMSSLEAAQQLADKWYLALREEPNVSWSDTPNELYVGRCWVSYCDTPKMSIMKWTVDQEVE